MPTSNLPSQLTPFIGRDKELAEIASLLADPTCHLLTLIGPGGIGKTRLVLEVAANLETYPNGVYFVALQPLNSPDFIVPAIADVLNFQFYAGSQPKPQLLDYLREKSLLLVLDNFEHLLDGVELVSELLAFAPGLKILVTSREALNLQEEWVYPAKGLHFPQTIAGVSIEGYSAVQLFTQSARRMRADFTLLEEQAGVIRICQLVEGMPLGIELASAWVRALSCAEIATEIERSLDILTTTTRNVSTRHRTMRAALEHSWALLTDSERAVFKKLSVFRRGFTREAAHYVAGATLQTLSTLVDKSLLRVDVTRRYDIHDLVRHFGEERLNEAPDEHDQIRGQHSTYYAEFLHRQGARLRTRWRRAAVEETEAEMDNVRQAWRYMVEKHQAAEIRKSAYSLAAFLGWTGRFHEAFELFGLAAEVLRPASTDPEIGIAYGLVLALQGGLYTEISAWEKAKALGEESLAILRRLNNPDGMILALENLLAPNNALNQMAEWEQTVREGLSIARENGDLWWMAQFLSCMGSYANSQHKYTEGAAILLQGLSLAEQSGDPVLIGDFYRHLGDVTWKLGDYSEAKQRYKQGLKLYRETDHFWGIGMSYWGLAEVAASLQDFAEARRYYRQELEIDLSVGTPRWQTDTLLHITQLLVAQAEKASAIELLSLVQQHPATAPGSRDATELRLIELQAELAPDIFAAAVERGKSRDLETTVKELITEFGKPIEGTVQLTIGQPLPDGLTERELEVLQLLAAGCSNQEIADRLFIGVSTVKKHINHIFSKLAVESRTQAMVRARAINLV